MIDICIHNQTLRIRYRKIVYKIQVTFSIISITYPESLVMTVNH